MNVTVSIHLGILQSILMSNMFLIPSDEINHKIVTGFYLLDNWVTTLIDAIVILTDVTYH